MATRVEGLSNTAAPRAERRGERRSFSVGRKLLAVAAVLLLFSSAFALWASAYDRRSSPLLPDGAVVAGVPVGGLSYRPALALVRQRVETPLRQPVVVTADDFKVTTTAWDLGFRANSAAAVHRVLDRAQAGGMVGRVWRRWFGPEAQSVTVTPRWTSGPAARILEQARQATFVAPVPARLDTSSGWVNVMPDQPGRVLDDPAASGVLAQAVQRRDHQVTLPTRSTVADVRAAAFSTVILVRTGENMLHLYRDGQIVKSYAVATGTARYATPKGHWRLVNKLVNPVWTNPNSEWSTNMPARIGPGPTNPLGTRALALNAPGILIHATPDTSSIGFNASHGCIRMLPADEEDLFNQVAVGIPVAIVEAGPPRPRGSKPATPAPPAAAAPAPVPGAPVPAPASPTQDAATQF